MCLKYVQKMENEGVRAAFVTLAHNYHEQPSLILEKSKQSSFILA